MQRTAALALAAATLLALLAGCSGEAEPDELGASVDGDACPAEPCGGGEGDGGQDGTPPRDGGEGTLDLSGTVMDPALRPIAGARVSIDSLGIERQADAAGQFSFEDVPARLHQLRGNATGYLDGAVTVTPASAAEPVVLILEPVPDTAARNETLHFAGVYQCALEFVFFSGACDALVIAANDEVEAETGYRPLPEAVEQTYEFEMPLEPAWATMVVDVAFDPSANPGLDGFRLVVRGVNDSNSSGAYEQYGRWHDGQPFSARLEPGQTYEDGTGPVPQNTTAVQFAVYPHSFGYGQVCIPTQFCPLGVGLAADVQFDVFATVFYNEAAPEGFTLLAA